MTYEQQWLEMKPKIIKYLEEGWSKSVAYRKAGLHEHSKLKQLYFKYDIEFREQIKKYTQKSYGFYDVITSVPRQSKRPLKSSK